MDDPQHSPSGRRPNRDAEFEVAFGQRIRAARVAARMSMEALGEAINVSYQQVQKYETGRDRVSVGALQAIADALGVTPGSFFSGEAPAVAIPVKDVREAQRIGERIVRLNDPSLIRRLLALVDILVEAGSTDPRGQALDPFSAKGDHP